MIGSLLYFETLTRGLKSQDGLAMLIEQARLSAGTMVGSLHIFRRNGACDKEHGPIQALD